MNYHLSRIISLAKSRNLPAMFINRYLATSNPYYFPTNAKSQSHPASQNKKSDDNELDEPIQFFGSKAAVWQAKQTRSGGYDEMLWYQPYVVTGSVAIFLIYFCILREENDIDKKLEGSLYDHVSGLEETQLFISYKYNKENGLDVTDLEKRLNELGIDISKL